MDPLRHFDAGWSLDAKSLMQVVEAVINCAAVASREPTTIWPVNVDLHPGLRRH